MTFAKIAVPLLLVAGLAAGAAAQDMEAATDSTTSAATEAVAPTSETAAVPAEADANPSEAMPSAETPSADETGEPMAATEADEGEASQSAATDPGEHGVTLGPVGHDALGRAGRIHVVQRGDTLWDISDAYLGTPWVWPSLWKDNDDIENPHLIHPGDHIWISPWEMRKVTEAEAAALLAGRGASADSVPAALAEIDAMPTPVETLSYPSMATLGFVTREMFEGASSIVDSPQPRKWLSQESEVLIGFGAGQVQVGDQFDIFRTEGQVKDLDTGLQYGWSTKQLGWLEVTAVHEETATAIIRHSVAEIQRGDHVLPRRVRPAEIQLVGSPGPVEGRIIHLPDQRMEIAQRDVVYLDRGKNQGVAVGNALEVYRRLGDEGMAYDAVQKVEKRVPDHVVAKLLVMDVFDDTSVALVMHTTEELNKGDQFRGAENVNP